MAKTFYAERAEQEANKIGMKFAHSSDVVRDMSRAYHVDFSNIRVHHDAAADSRVRAAGKDALAQGNELFFGKGIFESSDPASKGLVAHEFAHTMQQGTVEGAGAVQESAPMGAEQGGLRDWFKRRFGKKKDSGISAPTLMDTFEADGGYKIHGASQDDQPRRFMTTQSRAIFQMVQNATPEQLRSPEMRKLVLDDYRKNMTARLQGYESSDYSTTFSMLRGATAGEQASYGALLRANLPENIINDMSDNFVSAPVLDENGEQKRNELGRLMTTNNAEEILEGVGEQLIQDPVLMEILQANMDALGSSSHFSGENENRLSPMVMNTAILRGIAPELTPKNVKASSGVQSAANLKQDLPGVSRFLNILKRKK